MLLVYSDVNQGIEVAKEDIQWGFVIQEIGMMGIKVMNGKGIPGTVLPPLYNISSRSLVLIASSLAGRVG